MKKLDHSDSNGPGAGKPAQARRIGREDLSRIGRYLRTQRVAAEMTVPRLAERSGLSIGAIRAIEAGQSNPSLATVLAIVESLGLSLDALIEAARGDAGQVVVVTRAGEGDLELSLGLDAPRLAAKLIELPVKSMRRIPDEDATNPVMGMVVAGNLVVTTGSGERVLVDGGDTYHAQAGHVKGWANRGIRPARLLHVSDTRRDTEGRTS